MENLMATLNLNWRSASVNSRDFFWIWKFEKKLALLLCKSKCKCGLSSLAWVRFCDTWTDD